MQTVEEMASFVQLWDFVQSVQLELHTYSNSINNE